LRQYLQAAEDRVGKTLPSRSRMPTHD